VQRAPRSARVEFFRDEDNPNKLVGFTLETFRGRRSSRRTRFYRGLVSVELPLLKGEELPRDELAVVQRALSAAKSECLELMYARRAEGD
jgi:hypothetical protein